MIADTFDATLRELLRQEPVLPFVVELVDGQRLEIDKPRLAVNVGGATLVTPDRVRPSRGPRHPPVTARRLTAHFNRPSHSARNFFSFSHFSSNAFSSAPFQASPISRHRFVSR